METTPTYYIDLITRYFFGEATPQEVLELEKWVMTNQENRELFSAYRKTWEMLNNSKALTSSELDREWNILTSKLNENPVEEKSEQLTNNLFKSSSVAGNSSFVIRHPSFVTRFLRIAAIFILIAVPAFLLFRYAATPADRLVTSQNTVTGQTLPDGTVVTLNTGATLTYPSRFIGPYRMVTLQGEAWFDVSPDKSKPFIIAAGNVRIQVVGTTFFVNTKTGNNTREVILATGKVKVYYEDKRDKMALLSPGEKADLSDGYTIVKAINEDRNYLAWKTKHLVFANTRLDDVVGLLKKVYHTDISLTGGNLSNCRITTTFDKQTLESILNVLKATLDLQIRNSATGIELSGQGCN